MKRVISSTIEGELRSMYSLIGETFRNDGKELKEALSPYTAHSFRNVYFLDT